MKYLIFTLIIIYLSVSTVFCCSMIANLPTSPMFKPNTASYIFTGEVIGYTNTIKSKNEIASRNNTEKFWGEGKGYKIRPIERINLPIPTKDYYEVFFFGVTPWCAPKLHDINLPIGAKVRLVANETTLLPNRSSENKVRLEIKIFDRFSLVKDNEEFRTNKNYEFDYQTYWKVLANKFSKNKDSEKINSFDDFIYLETTKDLIRLENAKSKNVRYKILERMLYNPKVDFPALISPTLSRYNFSLELSTNVKKERNIKLTETEKSLLQKRKELETSGYFQTINVQ